MLTTIVVTAFAACAIPTTKYYRKNSLRALQYFETFRFSNYFKFSISKGASVFRPFLCSIWPCFWVHRYTLRCDRSHIVSLPWSHATTPRLPRRFRILEGFTQHRSHIVSLPWSHAVTPRLPRRFRILEGFTQRLDSWSALMAISSNWLKSHEK